MATLTEQEIEQLQQQLKEKTKEVKEIYDKLVEAGAVPIADDFLDTVAGGLGGLSGKGMMTIFLRIILVRNRRLY